jgi:peptidoglycan/xylan/chitin deacetylase (PgdA/CDA1 family)
VECSGDALARLGVRAHELADEAGTIRLIGLSRYLNDARAVVTHSIDDTTHYLHTCLDTVDAYGIKATIFISTGAPEIVRLWPRLRQAVADGHELGAHSRRHRCTARESLLFCIAALSRYEVHGARRDILAHTQQPYVWTWAYPCGNCADRKFAHRKIALAGYVAARAYPAEHRDAHLVPDLRTYDPNPLAARYTQVVQKAYRTEDGALISGRTDVKALNAKFDEVYEADGIYSFVSHPQMLDYGPDAFYESHLAHVGGRKDIWYVPMGPLYAYHVLRRHTSVAALRAGDARAQFAVFHRLDPQVYSGSVTLEFHAAQQPRVIAGGRQLAERDASPVDRWDGEYVRRAGQRLWVTIRPNTVVEFR